MRKRLSRRSNKRLFARTARRVKRVNLRKVLHRGGYNF